jgi:hypothetical protein
MPAMNRAVVSAVAVMGLIVASANCRSRRDAAAPARTSSVEASSAGAAPSAVVPRGACAAYRTPVAVGTIASGELDEVSGIAASRTRPGALFVHNDSGDSARVFAIDRAGAVLLEMALPVEHVIDCEDIAAGPGPTGPSVYLGDIGDNAARDGHGTPRKQVVVYRFGEPRELAGAQGGRIALARVDALPMKYPDHPHDAETLMVDPANGDLYVVTKEEDGNSGVYRAAAPLTPGAVRTLERVASIALGPRALGAQFATGGDISPIGDAIVVRTYFTAFLWRRASGQSVAAALGGARQAIPIAAETQGEAIGFASDGSGYFTASEGTSRPLYFAGCR